MTTLKKCLMFSLAASLMLASAAVAKELYPPEGVVEQKIIMLTVRYWKDTETLQTKEACDVPQDENWRAMGCTVLNGPGRATLNLVKPRNWCDWENLKTVGHELMHALGENHSGYLFTTAGPAPWNGGNCAWSDVGE